jgi:hypothetical protein
VSVWFRSRGHFNLNDEHAPQPAADATRRPLPQSPQMQMQISQMGLLVVLADTVEDSLTQTRGLIFFSGFN